MNDGCNDLRIHFSESVAVQRVQEIQDGLVRFHRSNGSIKGFELDAGRVTNLKFEKR